MTANVCDGICISAFPFFPQSIVDSVIFFFSISKYMSQYAIG